jgi:hypothetical protein
MTQLWPVIGTTRLALAGTHAIIAVKAVRDSYLAYVMGGYGHVRL